MFTYPFRYVPSPEVRTAAAQLIAKISGSPHLDAMFREGKMLGVLVCSAPDGSTVILNGFSGLAGGLSHIPGFVPPIFDWSDPDGYFRLRESEISAFIRTGGSSLPETSASQTPPGGPLPLMMPRAAQFPEGTATSSEIQLVGSETGPADGHYPSSLVVKGSSLRTDDAAKMSAELQDWLFGQYEVLNARGEVKTVKDIFADRGLVPPGGTGDCAGPKMLQEAYRRGLKPLAMGEFWYGKSPEREVREQGRFYPSCTGKCGPLLTYMLHGLEVEPNPLDKEYDGPEEPVVKYEDKDILVVEKPSGMLSVPGRTCAGSLLEWLQARFGEVHSCHRLDMDTSGVMVYARNLESKVELERQFSGREVQKTYRARLVSGGPWPHAPKGTIALPLSLDYYDRPRQMVDPDDGKPAVTRYEVLRTLPDGEIDVRFTPLTGRSHQIRVHAAHSKGLGRPIKGDSLYGAPDSGRLFLMAESIVFRHPSTGLEMRFETEDQTF